MNTLLIITLIALPLSLHAKSLTEAQAVSKIKELPEFVVYSKKHAYAFDDNELIENSMEGPIWRIDVHTVVSDPVATHLSLWNRFFVTASSGNIVVWNRLETRQYISLREWREQLKIERTSVADP